jgi:hypothetical protein
MKIRPTLALPILALLLMALAVPTIWAQVQPRVSPHSATSVVVDGNRVSVFYGRPYMTHPRTGETRVIWGGLVPFDRVWRTGANEATLLTTQQPILIGDARLDAGAYSLFTIPKEDGTATLIINAQVGQWGTQYDESQDVTRVELNAKDLEEQVEQFTISVERGAEENTGVIRMMWDMKEFSVGYKKAG